MKTFLHSSLKDEFAILKFRFLQALFSFSLVAANVSAYTQLPAFAGNCRCMHCWLLASLIYHPVMFNCQLIVYYSLFDKIIFFILLLFLN